MVALDLGLVKILLDEVQLVVDDFGYPFAVCVMSARVQGATT